MSKHKRPQYVFKFNTLNFTDHTVCVSVSDQRQMVVLESEIQLVAPCASGF